MSRKPGQQCCLCKGKQGGDLCENGQQQGYFNIQTQDDNIIKEIGKTFILSGFCGILMKDHGATRKYFGFDNAECTQYADRY